jgi:hypothetical protein
MSLYNCFSNKLCNNLELSAIIEETEESTKSLEFLSSDTNYKIYMLPVKLNQCYTIAIDSPTPVEVVCGLFNKKYLSADKDLIQNLAKLTYVKYGQLQFNQPVLFSKLTAENLKQENQLYTDFYDETELVAHESDLKLFIKLPANNHSSIVVLEGDYRMNKAGFVQHQEINNEDRTIWHQNYTVTNFENLETGQLITSTEYADQRSFKPISRSQLLMYNTGKSYPFADRLIEYLIGNAITPLDNVTDNVLRAQTVVYNKLTNPLTKEQAQDSSSLKLQIEPNDL